MNYQGDILLGDTIDVKFTTVSTTGIPTTLAGTPVIVAYVGNGTTEITAGITLSVDFDSRTGMHNVRVVASSGNGFATASNVNLVISAGTVGGNSVVGYVIGSFSIENRSAARVGAAMTLTSVYDPAKTASTQASITTLTGYVDTEVAAILAAVDTEVAAIKAKTDALPTDPADASDIAASFTSLNTKVDTIDDFLDTEVAAIKLSTDHLATAMEVDGAVYRFTANALELGPVVGSANNGGTLRFDDIWKWTTAGSVSSGQIRGNVADWHTITELWIHNVTNGGTNLQAYLLALSVDDSIRVQQENSTTIWNSYLITSLPINMTTWVKVPVTLRASGSVGPPVTAQNCLVSFFRPSATDWTDTEKQQIRHRVGIDGTATAPAATPSLALQTTSTSIKTVTDKVDTALVVDGAVYQYTANALELGPAGGGGGSGDASQATLLAVKAKTDNLPSDPADASVIADEFSNVNGTLATISSSLPLDAGELNAIADALLKRDWNSVTGEAAYSALNAFRMLRNAWDTTGGTLSVKKEDGTTNAWTRTLSTDASADPIIGAT